MWFEASFSFHASYQKKVKHHPDFVLKEAGKKCWQIPFAQTPRQIYAQMKVL